jgi:hypothetical protein
MAASSTWKLDSTWPVRNWAATIAARPAPASRLGRRTTRSVSSSSHGMKLQTPIVG